LKISGGLIENGIVVGNAYDKYGSSNIFERWLVQGFVSAMTELVDKVNPTSIHEVGCGEGYWTLKWLEQGIVARGSDFSSNVTEMAQANALSLKLQVVTFKVCNIYDLNPDVDAANLVVCCEVLEHLECPEDGLQALQAIASPYLIISVPREPLWSAMNMARGKYWTDWGREYAWPYAKLVSTPVLGACVALFRGAGSSVSYSVDDSAMLSQLTLAVTQIFLPKTYCPIPFGHYN